MIVPDWDYKSRKLLLNNQEYSDFHFILSDGSIVYAHKLILTFRSPYFKHMFQSGSPQIYL
jgi:hypothetical protein